MRPIRIATVYTRSDRYLTPWDMSTIRWIRISQELARLGHEVDMIVNADRGIVLQEPRLRLMPYARARWSDYDVIKTLFHGGFVNLLEAGGGNHPFIISKLGSVVGDSDETEGVYFFGAVRRRLFDIQGEIAETSKYVTVLTKPSLALWQKHFPSKVRNLLVPGGTDRDIPPRQRNPYGAFDEKIAVYIGHIYTGEQKEINLLWQRRLNTLGEWLRKRRIRLCLVGTGDVEELDPRSVTYLGRVLHSQIWDYHYFADVGIALAHGPVQHNESSKLYYYLRAGTPVVVEAPIPNSYLVRETKAGFVVDFDDMGRTAELIEEAAHKKWDTQEAIASIKEHHTWTQRAETYDQLLHQRLRV